MRRRITRWLPSYTQTLVRQKVEKIRSNGMDSPVLVVSEIDTVITAPLHNGESPPVTSTNRGDSNEAGTEKFSRVHSQ